MFIKEWRETPCLEMGINNLKMGRSLLLRFLALFFGLRLIFVIMDN